MDPSILMAVYCSTGNVLYIHYCASGVASFTFMWPCVVTPFFLINQQDARISKILFCQRTLRVSGISFAHHQEFSTVHSTLVYFLQFWWQLLSSSVLTLLGSCHQTCKKYTNVECTVENSWRWTKEMPETCRVFWQNKNLEIRGLVGFIKEKGVASVHLKSQPGERHAQWTEYCRLVQMNAVRPAVIFRKWQCAWCAPGTPFGMIIYAAMQKSSPSKCHTVLGWFFSRHLGEPSPLVTGVFKEVCIYVKLINPDSFF